MDALPKKILIVDDDIGFCNLLRRMLQLEGYDVFTAFDMRSATDLLKKNDIDTVLLDVMLPDGNGTIFTGNIKHQFPAVRVIILTGLADIAGCVQAIKNGANDYIIKGDDFAKIILAIKEAVDFDATAIAGVTIENLKKITHGPTGFNVIIGSSTPILKAKELAEKIAGTNASVLLCGETGTGKELFAKAIHNSSERRSNPFVAVNCSALAKDLLESELFGHEAGAFTGAHKEKKGMIEEADGGTLFLDEIGEMNVDLQAKLLRVLETQEFLKVGGTVIHKINIRIISATNKDLQIEIAEGRFREDLFYRLNVFTITLPSLKERGSDVVLLAGYFIKIFAQKLGKNIQGMTEQFKMHLTGYQWKGNIRELKNIIERAVILAPASILSEDLLPPQILSPVHLNSDKNSSPYDLSVFERLHIQKVLTSTRWNKSEAARLLNISVSTLYRKIEDYMLSHEENN